MNPDFPTPQDGGKQEQTPLPWRRHDMESLTIVGPDGLGIAVIASRSRPDEEDYANFEFILSSVNSIAGMRARVEELEGAGRELDSALAKCTHLTGESETLDLELAKLKFRAALKLTPPQENKA